MKQLQFPKQSGFYRGKVRDVYTIANNWLVMIASDRISAFDVVLPRPIPFKGQVLNQVAAYMLKASADICPNWLIEVPAPNAAIGRKCEPYLIEMVVRGNLSGHAWRTYASGKREICGEKLPEGLKENDFLPSPIITPSTKATVGHDEDISRNDIIGRRLVGENEYFQIERFALALFARGNEIAAKRGLILADTKYEFGRMNGEIYLIDEIHTPDSSRYFYSEGFAERQRNNEKQKQLSKEFVREWLIANEFMGKDGQKLPEMTDEWISAITNRYIELCERIIGERFVPVKMSDEEIFQHILYSLANINPQ